MTKTKTTTETTTPTVEVRISFHGAHRESCLLEGLPDLAVIEWSVFDAKGVESRGACVRRTPVTWGTILECVPEITKLGVEVVEYDVVRYDDNQENPMTWMGSATRETRHIEQVDLSSWWWEITVWDTPPGLAAMHGDLSHALGAA